ncbi:hypothetical protein PMAYCL1PPCAC_28982 [Pristionchus mayeri]|uniref:beta-N-acetylhexosaminidase n=1 Tax=Pristionchus mayeri TaxID=1317129 RepID=A0AAN5DA10_9BILA|nr:hypothetical protein PMAYCL1PPCAC_28982 [Pristionchus mayeri]
MRLLLFLTLISLTVAVDKYVHMDLKGAPPRPDYFKKSLDLFSKLGAKGVVIEWEDMFPLTGILSSASHGNAYSKADVIGILDYANRANLTVVPLVQTFGHAEWILKTALFEPLRENENYTNVFCIGNPATKDILSDLLSQVAQLHAAVTPMPFFHIGADEAMIQPGQCPEDVEMMEELGTNDTRILVYHHLRTVSKLIQDEFPETKILAWFDEFKFADAETIRDFELSERVTPVVWKYNADNLEQYLTEEMWGNLSQSFSSAWGGSAFKGANGNAKIDNEIVPYMSNNQQWRIQLDLHSGKFNRSIEAVIVTGWQRYDHFTGLCELLPTSMTALALSMKMLENGNVTSEDASLISSVLSCPNSTTIVNLIAGNDTCKYEGYKARDSIKEIVKYMKNFDDYTWIHNLENGWFGKTAEDRHFSSRYYIESLYNQYKKYLKNANRMKQDIINNFNSIFFSETASEFLFDRVNSFTDKLSKGLEDMSRIIGRRTFPVRPLF